MPNFLSETSRRLRVQTPEVLERWQARVLAEVPAASTVDQAVLRDHLHLLLGQVVTALSPDAPVEPTPRLTTSERHGGERALLESYSLGEVLQEYSILRRTVFEVLEEGQPMALHERAIVNDALEQALIGASTQYALVQREADHQEVEDARAEAAVLLEADRHKTQFLAWLGHELRTPLSVVSNALYLLDNLKLEDPRATRALAAAGRQTRLLSRLAEDLLDLSRINRATLELRAERLDLRGPVADAAEASQPQLEEQGHRFELHLPSEPLWVEGDTLRLVQVLTNLLNNSARYTPRGGTVSLTLGRDGAEAVVQVKDSGLGIEPSQLPRIFDPFVQVNSDPLAQQGIGIGLALVWRLVEMHGGTVTAHSPGLGLGSEFVMRLPLKDA